MNYSIQRTTNLNNSEVLNTMHLQDAVAYTEKRLRKSRYRLRQIEKNQSSAIVRKQAKLFLLEKNNLIELATKILTRMRDLHNTVAYDLSDFELELDLLDRMDYQLAKVSSPFVDKYFEIPIIQMNRLVAA